MMICSVSSKPDNSYNSRENSFEKMLKALCDFGIDANAVSSAGRTALSYAVERGYTKLIQLLLPIMKTQAIRSVEKVCVSGQL